MRRHKVKKNAWSVDTLLSTLRQKRSRPKHGKRIGKNKRRRFKNKMKRRVAAERKAFPPGYGWKSLPAAR